MLTFRAARLTQNPDFVVYESKMASVRGARQTPWSTWEHDSVCQSSRQCADCCRSPPLWPMQWVPSQGVRLRLRVRPRPTELSAAPFCGPLCSLVLIRLRGVSHRTDDIYFLEICLYSYLCDNGDDLFDLEVAAGFQCKLSLERLQKLRNLLTEGPSSENVAYRSDGFTRCASWCSHFTCDQGGCIGCGEEQDCSRR